MSSQDSDVTVAADEAPSSNGSSSPSLLSSASYSQDLANNDNNGAKQQLINYSTAGRGGLSLNILFILIFYLS